MAYYVGDTPAEDLVVEPARNGEPIDLTPFDSVEAVLIDPDGATVPSSGFLATIDDDNMIVVEWPTETVLEQPGMYMLRLTLESADHREQLAPIALVAQTDDGWHTLDSARQLWADGPDGDRQMFELLDIAKRAVIAYAPALPDGTRPPTSYARGQLMQARNVWNAGDVSATGETGMESFALTPHPLDWTIKQLLRPQRGIPAVR